MLGAFSLFISLIIIRNCMQKTLLICFFAFLVSLHSSAQWITYDVDNTSGISSDLVSSITESYYGEIWFGTDEGVLKHNRTDGTWEKFTTQQGMGSNFVYKVFEDRTGRIWATTNGGGVSKITESGVQSYTVNNSGLASNVVRSVVHDTQGKLWFATYGGGISRLTGNTLWTTFTVADGLPTNYFYSSFMDSDGVLWFGTSGHGVVKFSNGVWTNYTMADGLAGNTILDISESSEHEILFAGNNGISIYKDSTFETITMADGLASNLAYCVMEDTEGELRVGTDNGMNIIDGTSISLVTETNGLASNRVYCISQDSQHKFWLGHLQKGASHYDGTSWLHYGNLIGFRSDNILDVCEDLEGNMWFASYSGITKFNGASWQTFEFPSGVYQGGQSIAVDANNNVWIAALNSGLKKYDGTEWTRFTSNEGLPKTQVSYVFVDSKDNLWVAHGSAGGVSKYNGASWTHYENIGGTHKPYIIKIIEDGQGDIWAMHSNSSYSDVRISRFHVVTWINYHTSDCKRKKAEDLRTYDMDIDENGNVWFSVREDYPTVSNHNWIGGVMKYENSNQFSLYIDWPMHTNSSCQVLFDSYGQMWLGGRPNSYGYQRDTVISVMKDNNWQYFRVRDGIAGKDINKLYEDSNHNIWICTNDGVSKGNLTTLSIASDETDEVPLVFNYPNPFSSITTIEYTLKDEGVVQLSVFDISGKMVSQQSLGRQLPGLQKISFDGTNLSGGMYFIHIQINKQTLQGKINIVK